MTLLEGSVRRSGDQIRVSTQLIDASDASNIWSATYNRELTDIFALQDDVAAAIIDALKLHVGLNPSRGRPADLPEAHSNFLKAGIAAAEYDWKGTELFASEAIRLDPAFSEARELLAYSYWMMADSEYSIIDARKLMREQAAIAIAENPDLVLAKALFRIGDAADYSLLTDIKAFDQAAIEQPGDQRILNALFFTLFICGYLEEAHEIAEELVALDPLSPFANGRLPTALFALGRVDEGFSALEVFDQLDKDRKHWYVGDAHLSQGRDEIAIRSFEATLIQDGYIDTDWIKELINAGRNPEAGQSALDLAIPQIVNSAPDDISVNLATELTSWYLYFGFLDRYFELMQQEDLSKTNWTKGGEYLAQGLFVPSSGLRSHPKFIDVANTLGIIDVWEQRGPPYFCSRINSLWECR